MTHRMCVCVFFLLLFSQLITLLNNCTACIIPFTLYSFYLIIGNWEKFEEMKPKTVAKKLLSATSDDGSRGGAVCAADAMVSDSQWTALEDSNQFSEYDDSRDQPNLPFRTVQSMRVNTNRKVQIVDALRQRRLSNSSLDREPSSRTAAQFKNEDELTRTFKIEREWQVYVKMDKKVPGTK